MDKRKPCLPLNGCTTISAMNSETKLPNHVDIAKTQNGSAIKNGVHKFLPGETNGQVVCSDRDHPPLLLGDGKHFDEPHIYSCGLCSFKPRWLQPFANKKAFLAVFCLTSVLQGMYYTYFVSVLTTIEKLYQIQSKTTGIIMSATEIGQIGGALLLTYYGGQGHRPKWIACGMVVFAIASILCSTPHFMFGQDTLPSRTFPTEENATSMTLRKLRSKLCHSRVAMDGSRSVTTQSSFLVQTHLSLTESTFPPVHTMPIMDEDSHEDTSFLPPSYSSSPTYSSSHTPQVQNIPLVQKSLANSTSGQNNAQSFNSQEVSKCSSQNRSGGGQSQTTKIVLSIFFISLLFIGIGATAVYTLGIPYIDDNVATRESPLYFGITIGVRIFGPVFGFLLGSFCTSVHVSFPFGNPGLTTDDPQWIGAWWLGVFIVGAALILTSIPMLAFPRMLPKPEDVIHQGAVVHMNGNANGAVYKNHQQPNHYHNCNGVKHSKKPSLKDFPTAMRRLLKNDILICRTASSVLHILPIAGLYTFLPKYLESQFQLTATKANMISGMAGILVMGVGIFASGSFMRKFKPNARFVARWIAMCALAYALGMVVLMWLGCPLNEYVGLNAGSPELVQAQKTCNSTCNCRNGEFAPICTSDGVTYLSPCLAGCTEVSSYGKDKYIFKNCYCLDSNVTATNGFCPLKCDNLVWYIIIFSFFVLVHSTSEVGSMLLTLRCVDPQDKAMALGLISFAIGLFGNVPCPIIYGAVVDSACLFWEDNCGEPGACRLYDPSKFRMVFHGVTAVIMLIAFVVDAVVWFKAKSIHFHDEEEDAEPEETMPINLLHCTQFESSV